MLNQPSYPGPGRHDFIILDSKQICILGKINQNKKAVSVSAHKLCKMQETYESGLCTVEAGQTLGMSGWEAKVSEMKEYNRAENTVREG